MPRPFYQATAEQVVAVSEAVASMGLSDNAAVAAFTDLLQDRVDSALKLSVDLGLLQESAGQYSIKSHLSKFLRTPQDNEKAAILRVTIESYDAFLVFREELESTGNVTDAAQRTKVKLDLDCHREQIKETLLSLATYSGALTAGQGTSYERDARGLTAMLDELAAGSREVAEATLTIRVELGSFASQIDDNQILSPLVAALRHAAASNSREAVLQAGIAVENFLTDLANKHGISVVGANGINAKMERLVQGSHYPKKLQNVCRYIGHIRNAADHGSDTEINAPWNISKQTGRNYVFVVTSFIKSMMAHDNRIHEI